MATGRSLLLLARLLQGDVAIDGDISVPVTTNTTVPEDTNWLEDVGEGIDVAMEATGDAFKVGLGMPLDDEGEVLGRGR